MILQRQIEQRRERRKCLDADIRLSCQKRGVRVCRPVEHPGRDFKPPICLRPIKRTAEDDKTTLVDGTMNANSVTKPGMMPIKNLAKNCTVGVLKPRCTTTAALTKRWTTRRRWPCGAKASKAPTKRLKLWICRFVWTTGTRCLHTHSSDRRNRRNRLAIYWKEEQERKGRPSSHLKSIDPRSHEWGPPSGIPSFSYEAKDVGENGLLGQHLVVSDSERPQPVLGHCGNEVIEQTALAK